MVGRHAPPIVAQIGLPVVAPGYLANDADLLLAYRAANVTLIPSLAELRAYVALDSLCCRTPVVAFAVGGLAEIITQGGGGLLAPPYDVAQLVQHMQRLLADPGEAARMGAAGHDWVAAAHDPAATLAAHERIYDQVLATATR